MIVVAGDLIPSGGVAAAQRRLDRLQHTPHRHHVPKHHMSWARLYRCRAMLGPTHQGYAVTHDHYTKVIEITSKNLLEPEHHSLYQSALYGNIRLANNQLLPRVAAPLIRLLQASGDPRAAWFD
ncbi:MAG: hypothetical protein ACI9MC_003767, partial [Kiritimatiellia bacterium]